MCDFSCYTFMHRYCPIIHQKQSGYCYITEAQPPFKNSDLNLSISQFVIEKLHFIF